MTEPIPYEDFRSGATWDQVREELYAEQMEVKGTGNYMFVSRGTVLGRMHQRKLEAYEGYLTALGLTEEEITSTCDAVDDDCWLRFDGPAFDADKVAVEAFEEEHFS